MNPTLTFPAALSLVALLAASARAQIIVQDGDDLKAIVASAPSGSVIEIHSDATFTGSLQWAGKDLVVRAGSGFEPRIQGWVSLGAASAATHGALSGLRIHGVVRMTASTGGASPSSLALTDCAVDGMVSLTGGGAQVGTLKLLRTHVRGSFIVSASGGSVANVVAADCSFNRNFVCQSFGQAQTHVDLRRSRVGLSVIAQQGSGGVLALDVESSLIAGPGSSLAGVSITGTATARLVNATITGFATGLEGNATTTGENLLLYGNAVGDLGAGIGAAQIANSLIEDGTFAGLNGNFGGTPLVAPNFSLLPGSIGIDAGNNAAIGLGGRDLYGAPRIHDGDGNGTSIVDVGAVEL